MVNDVGVTIAKRRKQKGFQKDSEVFHSKPTAAREAAEAYASPQAGPFLSSSSTTDPVKKQSTSVRLFLEGGALYATCLILPTALGFILRFYDDPSWWQRKMQLDAVTEDPTWSSYVYDSTAYYLCPEVMTSESESSDSSFVKSWGLDAYQWWCPDTVANAANATYASTVLSPDADWTDFGIIAVLSVTLAVLRLTIVNFTVHPLQDSAKLEALVRCKSIHLLGSEYSASLTPRGTPRGSITLASSNFQTSGGFPDASLMMPNLSSPRETAAVQPDVPESGDFGLGLDESDRGMGSTMSPFAAPLTPPRPSIDTTDHALQQSMLKLSNQLSSTIPLNDDHDNAAAAVSPTSSQSNRLYAGPRYATAVFRLVYCTAATLTAILWFRDANFWPWYVGGHGSTLNCWDLSGGLTLGMDSDFDQRNTVLRRYFLLQASYHWHSGAFHLISMCILLLHPVHEERRFLSVKSTTSAYVRSLVQHLLSLVLIATVYVFSSLRRLGAIGMFAFDVSSWFLHLLQICINAPDESRWKAPVTVARIRSWLVIPSFVVTRFVIWPILWYSLEVESAGWLVQLENMLVPGSAFAMRCIFHSLMILVMGSTVVYFRRLLNHPHLQRILKQAEYATD